MISVPILCINVNTDIMLKFDVNAEANVDVDVRCEQVFSKWPIRFHGSSLAHFSDFLFG